MDFQRFFAPSTQSKATAAPATDAAKSSASIADPDHDLELRRAKLGDLPALTDLLTSSFHSASQQPFWLQAILRFSIQEDLRQRLNHSAKNQTCWVAIHRPRNPDSQEPAQLVGTVELGLRSPLTLGWPLTIDAWLNPNRSLLYISNLAVAANFRRRGIAQQLLQRCEKTAQTWQQSELYLHVLENNQAARNLYNLAGFGFERVDPSLESILFNRDRRQLWRKALPKH